MNMNANYPDDIRSFDNVPGSPFYECPEEKREDAVEAEIEGIIQKELTLPFMSECFSETAELSDALTELICDCTGEDYWLEIIDAVQKDASQIELGRAIRRLMEVETMRSAHCPLVFALVMRLDCNELGAIYKPRIKAYIKTIAEYRYEEGDLKHDV